MNARQQPQSRGAVASRFSQSGADDPYLSRPTMSLFKKSKKSRQPSKQPTSLGIPAHIVAGPLGFGPTLDPNVYPEGAPRSNRIQRPVGLILLLRQVKTMEGALKSHSCPGGARVSRLVRRVLQPGLPSTRTVLEVSVRFTVVFETHAHDFDSTARKRT